MCVSAPAGLPWHVGVTAQAAGGVARGGRAGWQVVGFGQSRATSGAASERGRHRGRRCPARVRACLPTIVPGRFRKPGLRGACSVESGDPGDGCRSAGNDWQQKGVAGEHSDRTAAGAGCCPRQAWAGCTGRAGPVRASAVPCSEGKAGCGSSSRVRFGISWRKLPTYDGKPS